MASSVASHTCTDGIMLDCQWIFKYTASAKSPVGTKYR